MDTAARFTTHPIKNILEGFFKALLNATLMKRKGLSYTDDA